MKKIIYKYIYFLYCDAILILEQGLQLNLSKAKIFFQVALPNLSLSATKADRQSKKRWLYEEARSLVLEEFDRDRAIAILDKGQVVIPMWLDKILQKLI